MGEELTIMGIAKDCLGKKFCTLDQIEVMIKAMRDMNRDKLESVFLMVCFSHERLRAELDGAEILLNEVNCPHCGPKCDLR